MFINQQNICDQIFLKEPYYPSGSNLTGITFGGISITGLGINEAVSIFINGVNVNATGNANKGDIITIQTLRPEYPYTVEDGQSFYNISESEMIEKGAQLGVFWPMCLYFKAFAIE